MSCMKTLCKLPMAAIGLIDLAACGAEKAICKLAKRGEKAVKKMEKKMEKAKSCCECNGQDDIPQTSP